MFLKEEGIRPEQVQDFYPTPGTISTCMFHTGLDPYTMEPVYVPRTPKEKAEQRAMLQYFKPENHALIRQALIKAGRRDLIGSGPHCLVPADPHAAQGAHAQKGGRPQKPGNRPAHSKPNGRTQNGQRPQKRGGTQQRQRRQ